MGEKLAYIQLNSQTACAVRSFSYDERGNLVSDGVSHYLYDAFNRRVRKTIPNLSGGYGGLTGDIPAGTFDYYYDGQQIIEERNDSTGTWTKVKFWGQYIDELLFFTVPTTTTYRVLSDLLYRSTAIVTTSNVITEAYDTDAYGNTLCYSGPGTDSQWFTDDDVTTNNPINTTIFTGRDYDPESQLYYYRNRYYSPNIGRFLQRDAVGSALGITTYSGSSVIDRSLVRLLWGTRNPNLVSRLNFKRNGPIRGAEFSQGANLYWYAGNNPSNGMDPTGEMCLTDLQNLLGLLGTGALLLAALLGGGEVLAGLALSAAAGAGANMLFGGNAADGALGGMVAFGAATAMAAVAEAFAAEGGGAGLSRLNIFGEGEAPGFTDVSTNARFANGRPLTTSMADGSAGNIFIRNSPITGENTLSEIVRLSQPDTKITLLQPTSGFQGQTLLDAFSGNATVNVSRTFTSQTIAPGVDMSILKLTVGGL